MNEPVLNRRQIVQRMLEITQQIEKLDSELTELAAGLSQRSLSTGDVPSPPARETVQTAVRKTKKSRNPTFESLNEGKKLNVYLKKIFASAPGPLTLDELVAAMVKAKAKFPAALSPREFLQLRLYQNKVVRRVPNKEGVFELKPEAQ
jgi:hypothetical protein